ncbi:MAG: CAP domain-containing protein [Sporolactobacillus sp.]
MYKKILALTLAGALAIPFAFGHVADAASQSQPKAETFNLAFADILNPWHLKTDQVPALAEILKSLGIPIDLSQLSTGHLIVTDKTEAPSAPTTAEAPKKDDGSSPAPAKAPAAPTPAKPAPSESGSSSPAPSSEPAEPSSQPSTNSQMNAYENKVVELTNDQRVKAGLKPLQSNNNTLARMARDKSQDMANKNYFDHQSPTYGSPFDMMKQYGISYSYAGENIAAGQKTPEEVVDGWMNSPGHRANILNANFTTIGVGYVQGGSYGSYWTQEFIGN